LTHTEKKTMLRIPLSCMSLSRRSTVSANKRVSKFKYVSKSLCFTSNS